MEKDELRVELTPQTMVDRVALAIMREENPDSRDQYREMAVAALEAMREPTPRMIERARTCIKRLPEDQLWLLTMSHRESHTIKMRARMSAMIDAAISEATPPLEERIPNGLPKEMI